MAPYASQLVLDSVEKFKYLINMQKFYEWNFMENMLYIINVLYITESLRKIKMNLLEIEAQQSFKFFQSFTNSMR